MERTPSCKEAPLLSNKTRQHLNDSKINCKMCDELCKTEQTVQNNMERRKTLTQIEMCIPAQ